MKYLLLFTAIFCCLPTIMAQTDSYYSSPQGTYESRRNEFLQYYAENGDEKGLYSVFRQAARATAGLSVERENLQDVLAVIKSNRDCNDFALNCLLRMVYLNNQQKYLPEDMKDDIKERILDFKYWWDDGRRDTTYRCYHTENHQALYHTAELLAGQLYKKERFTNGMTGKQHIKHALPLINNWLNWRFRFGFSEWMSTYYDVEVLLLANLYDFAEDKQIRSKAKAVLDLLMFDLALNNYRGYLASASGRTYATSLINGAHLTSSLTRLVFGVGTFKVNPVMAPVALASSNYRCPQIICDIATDYNTPMLSKQRVSINVEDAPAYGLSYDKEEDCHLFWGMQEFIHPMAIRMSKQISEKYDVWPYRNYNDYIRKDEAQTTEAGKQAQLRRDRFALSEANIETYRTADYMLSCAMDYRKGAPGYQQHIWQATLSNEALVYTNCPGGKNLRWSPNYWSGNEILPRAAQQRNVVVCIYNIPANMQKDFTHAYFPVAAFDEVHIAGHWIFGRKNNGYVALYSHAATELKADDRQMLCDLTAKGKQNVWICETGSQQQWGSFAKFIEAIQKAAVKTDGLNVSYTSPSEGIITYGWDKPFTVNGNEKPLRWQYRYSNPYCQAPFDSDQIVIERGQDKLILNLNK